MPASLSSHALGRQLRRPASRPLDDTSGQAIIGGGGNISYTRTMMTAAIMLETNNCAFRGRVKPRALPHIERAVGTPGDHLLRHPGPDQHLLDLRRGERARRGLTEAATKIGTASRFHPPYEAPPGKGTPSATTPQAGAHRRRGTGSQRDLRAHPSGSGPRPALAGARSTWNRR